MKLSPVAQNLLEWLALKTGLVPTPLAYSHFGFMMSKFLLEAADKGVFEAIAHQAVSLEGICTTTALNQPAVKSLLGVLASMSLIKQQNDLFSLTPKAKKWLLKDSANSLYWLLIFDNRVCMKWMDHTGRFLETGKGLQYHDTFSEEEWFYYQKAMEATARIASKEAARKIPVLKGATAMLDIGGAHGLYSAALCRRHTGLSAVILDLPQAVVQAEAGLEKLEMKDQLSYRAGNIITDNIGREQYDVILMASVTHHLTANENLLVAQKAFAALRPGGTFTIIEVLRPDKVNNADMLSALGDFFFALSSTSGTWSLDEIKQWQTQSGFTFYKKATFLTIPGYTAVTGIKL